VIDSKETDLGPNPLVIHHFARQPLAGAADSEQLKDFRAAHIFCRTLRRVSANGGH
jgi:hypothetical protein